MGSRLQDKIALVTGAATGIGAAIAIRYAEEGAVVVLSDINLEGAETVAAGITANGGQAYVRQQDVTDGNLWKQLVAEIVAQHGRLDVLVNNAGIGVPANVEQESLESWRNTQAVNGESVFLGTQAAIDAMKESGGSIINISSIEGIIGDPNTPAYNYSKGGVRIFTKSAALHCAKQGYGIRVNSVHPGYILTPMVEGGLASMAEEGDAMLERLLGEIPMGHMGEPLDIANGCLFLASDESRYMTGSELIIDGGYTCH
jgi:NAD(P)-dependent dehydrogenase (short-subunit alcohol dehydrogenase family)